MEAPFPGKRAKEKKIDYVVFRGRRKAPLSYRLSENVRIPPAGCRQAISLVSANGRAYMSSLAKEIQNSKAQKV
ncbi:hypothetical protein Nepgr_019369 [Nepenthes gracilis]|uniref:Uncharacterized protein n=1 Tax=Nepenthes gracilis TaxID=150966 RepID=A0AAD3STX0_NEPGR|nr:hypothetical protein Nepgr_019369 [Nepenthes gracilis]